MIKWMNSPQGITGFSYHPTLEVGFGLFLIVVAMTVPILFFWFNGVNFRQWSEWVFCMGFLFFFGWMGYTLAWQEFRAGVHDSILSITQDLRGPDFSITIPLADWQGISFSDAHDEQGKSVRCLRLETTNGHREIYRSVSPEEINAIGDALEILRKNTI